MMQSPLPRRQPRTLNSRSAESTTSPASHVAYPSNAAAAAGAACCSSGGGGLHFHGGAIAGVGGGGGWAREGEGVGGEKAVLRHSSSASGQGSRVKTMNT